MDGCASGLGSVAIVWQEGWRDVIDWGGRADEVI